ncbi:TPA: homoserine kinase, partial [Streptococcus suis]
LAPKDKEDAIVTALEQLDLDGTVHRLHVDTKGIQVI